MGQCHTFKRSQNNRSTSVITYEFKKLVGNSGRDSSMDLGLSRNNNSSSSESSGSFSIRESVASYGEATKDVRELSSSNGQSYSVESGNTSDGSTSSCGKPTVKCKMSNSESSRSFKLIKSIASYGEYLTSQRSRHMTTKEAKELDSKGRADSILDSGNTSDGSSSSGGEHKVGESTSQRETASQSETASSFFLGESKSSYIETHTSQLPHHVTTTETKKLSHSTVTGSSMDSGNSSDGSNSWKENRVRDSRRESESSGRGSLRESDSSCKDEQMRGGGTPSDRIGKFSLRESLHCYRDPMLEQDFTYTSKRNIIGVCNEHQNINSSLSRGINGSECNIYEQRQYGTSVLPFTSPLDLPPFPEDSENSDYIEGIEPQINKKNSHPPSPSCYQQYLQHERKMLRSPSGRESSGSFGSIKAILRTRLTRSTSLSMSLSKELVQEAETQNSSAVRCNLTINQPHRSFSLQLPLIQKSKDISETTTPMNNICGTPLSNSTNTISSNNQKMTVRRALSLLSVNSLLKSDSKSRSPKPVQMILRQPQRRHQTVRGLSGMAIDGSNQAMSSMYRNQTACGLYHSNPVYYPTATSLRSAYIYR